MSGSGAKCRVADIYFRTLIASQGGLEGCLEEIRCDQALRMQPVCLPFYFSLSQFQPFKVITRGGCLHSSALLQYLTGPT